MTITEQTQRKNREEVQRRKANMEITKAEFLKRGTSNFIFVQVSCGLRTLSIFLRTKCRVDKESRERASVFSPMTTALEEIMAEILTAN